METIPVSDPRHAAAMAVIDAMHKFRAIDPSRGTVQWIEDTKGRLIVFTRGEYKEAIRQAIGEGLTPEQYFELASPGVKGEPDEQT